MNNIITLPLLAELFSEAARCDRAEAQQFLLSFTDLIADGLASDGHVRIKGLGVFKRSLVKDKVRVEFVPDREFSDFINAPFAFFEPVDLEDSVSADMLEGVDAKDRKPEEEPIDESIDEKSQVNTVVEDEPQLQTSFVDTVTIETPTALVVVEEESVAEATPQDETVIEDTPQEDSVIKDASKDECVTGGAPNDEHVDEDAPQDEPIVVGAPPQQKTGIEEYTVDETQKTEGLNSVEGVSPRDDDASDDAESDDDEYDDTDDEKSTTTVWFWIAVMFICGVLAGFAVGYFCHDTIMPIHAVSDDATDAENASEPEPLTQSPDPLVDELPATPDGVEILDIDGQEHESAEPMVDSELSVAQQQTAAQTTPAQPAVYDKVTQNRTLTKMAKEHYGNKDYWVYIYMENNDVIKNPNNIKIGTELRIPPKSKYDVSTDENENIAAAKEKARELFNKYPN